MKITHHIPLTNNIYLFFFSEINIIANKSADLENPLLFQVWKYCTNEKWMLNISPKKCKQRFEAKANDNGSAFSTRKIIQLKNTDNSALSLGNVARHLWLKASQAAKSAAYTVTYHIVINRINLGKLRLGSHNADTYGSERYIRGRGRWHVND